VTEAANAEPGDMSVADSRRAVGERFGLSDAEVLRVERGY
jgi:hypothetical protein